jgi:hypothetical protein
VERLDSHHSSNQDNKNEPKWSRNKELAQERQGEEEEHEEHIKNIRIDSKLRTPEDTRWLGPPFPQRFMVLTLTGGLVDLSHKKSN